MYGMEMLDRYLGCSLRLDFDYPLGVEVMVNISSIPSYGRVPGGRKAYNLCLAIT